MVALVPDPGTTCIQLSEEDAFQSQDVLTATVSRHSEAGVETVSFTKETKDFVSGTYSFRVSQEKVKNRAPVAIAKNFI